MMTKEEYVVLALEKYEALQSLESACSFYEYEKRFDALWVELGRSVLEKTIGDVPENYRKKTKFGRVMEK